MHCKHRRVFPIPPCLVERPKRWPPQTARHIGLDLCGSQAWWQYCSWRTFPDKGCYRGKCARNNISDPIGVNRRIVRGIVAQWWLIMGPVPILLVSWRTFRGKGSYEGTLCCEGHGLWGVQASGMASLLGPEGPSKIQEVTLMRPIHGNL